jgi:hypothetical protein
MPITRARDQFDVVCGGVRYEFTVERLTKTELRQFTTAIQPMIDAFEAASEPYAIERATAKKENREPDYSGLPELPDMSEDLFGVTLPVIRERAVLVVVRDGDEVETFDAASRRDEFEEWCDVWVPDGPIIMCGRLMREARQGNVVARAVSPD